MEKTLTMQEKVRSMDGPQLDAFILERLQFPKDHVYTQHDDEHPEGRSKHLRFDMSGFGDNCSCAIHNNRIIQLFADCGIYNKMTFMHLDCYKGNVTLHYLWWKDSQDSQLTRSKDYTSYGTRAIIKSLLINLCVNENANQLERRL